MAGSRAQQAAIAISMKKAGKIPKGYHKMPDGTIMKNSEHKKDKKNGKVSSMAKKRRQEPRGRS